MTPEPVSLVPPLTPSWVGSPNFAAGRQGRRPRAIIVHVTEGSIAATDSWFLSPTSQVSAHYAVTKSAQVHQYVAEENTAWHAGRVLRPTWRLLEPDVNPNLYTIGIEHEAGADEEWPALMYERSARLIAEICIRWQIPIDDAHITGHRTIFAEKTCPGRGDVARLIQVARWRAGYVLAGVA